MSNQFGQFAKTNRKHTFIEYNEDKNVHSLSFDENCRNFHYGFIELQEKQPAVVVSQTFLAN